MEKKIIEGQKKADAFYNKMIKRHGTDVKSLGYKSQLSQRKRFNILCGIADLEGRSILDVGCGMGDLYAYLKERFHSFEYKGVDISKGMIAGAKKKYPDAQFEVGDALQLKGKKYDYVLGTGVDGFFTGHNMEVTRQLIGRMYGMCRIGTAISMLSAYSQRPDPISWYAPPEEIFTWCMGITRRVILRHDYMPHDFAVYLYRE